MDFLSSDVLLCGLIENDRLTEVHLEQLHRTTVLGNIYVGRVQRVLENINAAFVEISPGFSCYLPLENVKDPICVKRRSSRRISAQDELLVQVQKEAVKSKAATVSTNLSLTGRYVVLTTENKTVGISSRLDRKSREHYKELMEDRGCTDYGVIIRTNAKHAADDEILSEIGELENQLRNMMAHAENRTCFSCLYRTAPGYRTFLKNVYIDSLREIVTDIPPVYEELSAYCKCYKDLEKIPLRLYEDADYPLASLYNLNKQLERAVKKTVYLKSGGFLVIEPTEAMTVIDVNTGKSISGKDPQEHFRKTNLEAAKEIAHQIRLRNLSGIIIIDFIDLTSKADQQELLDFLKKQVRSDSVPVQVHDITRLNLVEVTRKKVEKSLREMLDSAGFAAHCG